MQRDNGSIESAPDALRLYEMLFLSILFWVVRCFFFLAIKFSAAPDGGVCVT